MNYDICLFQLIALVNCIIFNSYQLPVPIAMTEASIKLQRIKERILQLSKIDATEVFTHEQLERRKQAFNRKSIMNYQIPQVEDMPVNLHFDKNQSYSLKQSKPIFVLNTDFFRRHPFEANETNIIVQQELEQQPQGQKHNTQIFIEQNDKKQVQPQSLKAESPSNFMKLNPISNQQHLLPEQSKPVSDNSMATNIFNMTQPIANLFNNSSTLTEQSIFKLRTSISNSNVPILFTNTNLLFNNTHSQNYATISEAVCQQKDSLHNQPIDQINKSKPEQKQQLHYEQLKYSKQTSQIKRSQLFQNVLGQNKIQNKLGQNKQQPKLSHSQTLQPFIQLSQNQVNTCHPINDFNNKQIPSNEIFLFVKEAESDTAPKLKQTSCSVNLELFNNNTTNLGRNSSAAFALTPVSVSYAPNDKLKPIIETSLFGQSNTLKTPLFGFATKPSVDPILTTSLMNPSKTMFNNTSSLFDNFNAQQNKKQEKEKYSQSQTVQQSGKMICDRPFDNIKLNTKPPSPTIDIIQQPIIQYTNKSNQEQSDIQSNKQQLINTSEIGLRKELNLTAIGPGGKKIDVPSTTSFFTIQQKPNLFGQQSSMSSLFNSSPKKTPNFFTNSQPTQGGLFSSLSSGSLFGKQQLFSGLTAQNSNVGLFGNTDMSIFNINNKQAIPEGEGHQQEEEEESDGPIIAEDDANPQLSTGSYDYIHTDVTFKEVANKFRLGTKDIIENVVVSVQKFTDKPDKYIYVRMSNKCIVFTGKIIPKITQIRCLNNSSKNVEIKKILLLDEKIQKPQLVLLKIQFKDQAKGDKLIKQVSKVLNNEIS